jgi:hypothetical protein
MFAEKKEKERAFQNTISNHVNSLNYDGNCCLLEVMFYEWHWAVAKQERWGSFFGDSVIA